MAICLADFISFRHTICLLLHSFPSSSQKRHHGAPFPFLYPLTFSSVSAPNSSVLEIPPSVSGSLLACLSNLFSESWLIVPDTGMLKKHNEWLFYSDGPACLCFFMILSLSCSAFQERHSNSAPHLSKRRASDEDLITTLCSDSLNRTTSLG